VIVTKVGAVRGEDASWNPAMGSADLVRAVHDNLRNLGVDVLDVVNLRLMGRVHEPSEGQIRIRGTRKNKQRSDLNAGLTAGCELG
jgi:aryl-alcohol dehydrogenase-like predicted oxidoreductase